jgi:hypothetical protein
LPELLGQHLLRNPGDQFLEIRVALYFSIEQMEKDDQFPSTFQQSKNFLSVRRSRACISFP